MRNFSAPSLLPERWNMKIKISGIERHSLVNGPGVRYVLFTQGCPHACPGCQNPETWDIQKGKLYETSTVISDILATKYLDGVTFSGGDPLFQPEAIKEIAMELKRHGLNIWCYTGYTYEEILNGPSQARRDVLPYLDVLVDGRFVLSLKSENCLYRGSTNQRLIDVPSSLREGKCVEITKLNYGL